MVADPVGAMRETIAAALGAPGAADTVVRCEVVDLDAVARAAWKLALDVLNKPSEGMKIEAFGYSTVDNVLVASIDQARREILGE